MDPIEILMLEHRHIERVLGVLLRAVDRARAGAAADPSLFEKAVEFARLHADGSHHAKEEDVLFEAMFAHGLPRDQGPLACMNKEHHLGRLYTTVMEQAASRVRRGELAALDEMLESASMYAELLAAHIQKEDRFIYPLARQVLPPEVFEEMVARHPVLFRPPDALVAAADAIERAEAEGDASENVA